jgi:hypothetical protein
MAHLLTTRSGFSGDLNVISLQEVLQFLSTHRETGRLTLKTDEEEITVVFEFGAVSSVSTNDSTLLLGRLLVDQGFVTEEHIEQALALQAVAETPPRIGDVLIEMGHLTQEEINQAVAAQIEAALFRILVQSAGTFEYIPDRSRVTGREARGLEFEPLVLNATYLADKWLAEQGPAEVDTLPEGLVDEDILNELPDPEREMLVELLEGYTNLHTLAWRTGLSAKQFKDTVERLVQRALVRSAMVKDRNEQITGREASSEELVSMVDEVIDPWILDDLSRAARSVLLELLNGAEHMHDLARGTRLTPQQFRDAIDELLEQELIVVIRQGEVEDHDDEAETVPDAWYAVADESISASILRELTRPERRTLIEILNGRSSLHEMARETGLPVIVFKEGADQLIARGLIVSEPHSNNENSQLVDSLV